MEPKGLSVENGVVIPEAELRESSSRSGGPGGQHVNKVSTRITLRWAPKSSSALSEVQISRLVEALGSRLSKQGEIVIHVDGSRSQSQNRQVARERLVEIVREGIKAPTQRKKTRPTKASRLRRLDAKQRRSDIKKARRPPSEE